MAIFLDWTTFKAQVTTKGLLRFEDRDTFYKLFYNDFDCSILKSESPGADQVDFETNYKSAANKSVINTVETSPFASKTVQGKKLYKRVIGINQELTTGSNNIIYVATLAWAKMKEIQIINCDIGDTVNLIVLDTATGTYSTIPNYPLNQFGFNVNLPDKFFSQASEFDADIYAGLQLKFVYNSISDKTIRINFIMNEVV
jgi:hypothetical protein